MKKTKQLGMNPSTAAHRLRTDLLFSFAVKSEPNCYRCGKPLTRENFSIEHKIPWIDSDDPVSLFFDINNIAFSHKDCNYSAARRTNQKYRTREERLAGEREHDAKRRESGKRTEVKRLWRQKRRDLGLPYT